MINEKISKISFYVVAHADDWQLFMQPNVYNDLVAPDSKVVFIVTTAGDAGGAETYWAAREEGLKSSVRFCHAPLAVVDEKSATRDINHHTIHYWLSGNAVCYFLRLPDGNLDGNGFSTYNYQSLSKFRERQISTISAINNSTQYNDWQNLVTTIQAIILYESKGISDSWINYLNPDTAANPNDHSDHILTGHVIQDMSIISNLSQAIYVGYNAGNEQQNLPSTDLFWKAGMFAAYEKAVYDISGYSTLKESVSVYLTWCLRGANFITINT